jgi:hypothetical protein
MGILRRRFGRAHLKFRTLVEAFENEVRSVPVAPFHAPAVRTDVLFTRQPLGFQRFVVSPLDWNPVLLSEGFDPQLVLLRALSQGLFGNRVDAVHVPEEMDNVFLARQQRQLPLNDDAIKTVIYKDQQAAEQLVEGFHRSSPVRLASATRSCARRLVETRSLDQRAQTRIGHVRNPRSFHSQGLCP